MQNPQPAVLSPLDIQVVPTDNKLLLADGAIELVEQEIERALRLPLDEGIEIALNIIASYKSKGNHPCTYSRLFTRIRSVVDKSFFQDPKIRKDAQEAFGDLKQLSEGRLANGFKQFIGSNKERFQGILKFALSLYCRRIRVPLKRKATHSLQEEKRVTDAFIGKASLLNTNGGKSEADVAKEFDSFVEELLNNSNTVSLRNFIEIVNQLRFSCPKLCGNQRSGGYMKLVYAIGLLSLGEAATLREVEPAAGEGEVLARGDVE